jgi:hypothetical protein
MTYKVGDKVSIWRRHMPTGSSFVWMPAMDQYVGKTGVVITIGRGKVPTYRIGFTDGTPCPYFFHQDSLKEYVEQPDKIIPMAAQMRSKQVLQRFYMRTFTDVYETAGDIFAVDTKQAIQYAMARTGYTKNFVLYDTTNTCIYDTRAERAQKAQARKIALQARQTPGPKAQNAI